MINLTLKDFLPPIVVKFAEKIIKGHKVFSNFEGVAKFCSGRGYEDSDLCKVYALETAKYPELEMIFHPNILTEYECQEVCRAGEQGCCINPDDSCVYETREACDSARGDFYKDQYCSDIALCGCSEHYDKTCYDDDVYWLDSCGNMEEVAEDCDYASGTICRDIEGEKKCRSVNCEDT